MTKTRTRRAVRPFISVAWQARLQRVDHGWLDIVALPVVESSRVFRELDWSPSVVAMTVFREVHSGMCHQDAGATPALRRRTVSGAMRDLVTRGPVGGQRNRP